MWIHFLIGNYLKCAFMNLNIGLIEWGKLSDWFRSNFGNQSGKPLANPDISRIAVYLQSLTQLSSALRNGHTANLSGRLYFQIMGKNIPQLKYMKEMVLSYKKVNPLLTC